MNEKCEFRNESKDVLIYNGKEKKGRTALTSIAALPHYELYTMCQMKTFTFITYVNL